MTILTAPEAANTLRVDVDDPAMLDLLPGVDEYIKHATGRDWNIDGTIHPTAKSAARMLLVLWYDNPAGFMQGSAVELPAGLNAMLSQLEAFALRYRTFEGLAGAGAIALSSAGYGDQVVSLVGILGSSGDQSAKFESTISVAGYIQQISGDDLSGKLYRILLQPA